MVSKDNFNVIRDKKGRFVKIINSNFRFKRGNKLNLGNKHSVETIKKIADANKGKHFSPLTEFKKGRFKNKTYDEIYGKEKAEKIIEKISRTERGKIVLEKSKEKMRKARMGKSYEDLYGEDKAKRIKEKHSKFMKEKWKDENYARLVCENSIKGLYNRPTTYEQKICSLCLKYNLPFIYKGNGDFLINFKNPDFIDEKDKVVIEVFYSWYKLRDYGSIENYKKFCKNRYNPAGWKIIFIDENDLNCKNWEERCLKKIKEVLQYV